MKLPPPIPVNLEALPPPVRLGVSPDTPPERRLLFARAALPLPPEQLVAGLAVLCHDRAETVSSAARATLGAMPLGVLSAGVAAQTDPGVLDVLAREVSREGLPEMVAQHQATADDTIVYLAARGRGQVLEMIAANQLRYQRCPAIVEALYYNPETRMGTVSTVLENAVRLGLDLSHIPGYEEMIASILGEAAVKPTSVEPPQEAPPPEPAPSPESPPPPLETGQPLDVAAEIGRSVDQAMFEAGLMEAPPAGADDETFFQILASSLDDVAVEDFEDKKEKTPIWARLQELSVPQKVRLALLGNDFVRSLLIRDSRRIVYMSVLKSPRTSLKDVESYAKDRALPDEVIRTIAGNREWTKSYAVRQALIINPKCPPVTAMMFMRTLITKDLKHLAQSHEVPGYIARHAKQLLGSREGGKPQG